MSVTQPESPYQEWDDADAAWAAAFADICDRHRPRLIRWLTAIFGPRDAEDIAQEALVRLYARPGMVGPSTDPWPWLAVVARNVGRDLARHNALSTTVDNDVLATLPGSRNVSDEVIARDEADRLARALQLLSPRERHLIRLRDFEGAGIATVADLLGVSENAARQQLFRARRHLADAYVRLGGERGAGLVAVLGLRLRELARRCAEPFGALAQPAAALLALGGSAVAAAAGLVGTPARPATPAPGATRIAIATAGFARDTGHGTGAAGMAPHLGTRNPVAGADTAPTDPRPFLHDHRDAGPAHSDITRHHSPFSTAPNDGDEEDDYIWVDLPNGWRWKVSGHQWGDGQPGIVTTTVCSTDQVSCG